MSTVKRCHPSPKTSALRDFQTGLWESQLLLHFLHRCEGRVSFILQETSIAVFAAAAAAAIADDGAVRWSLSMTCIGGSCVVRSTCPQMMDSCGRVRQDAFGTRPRPMIRRQCADAHVVVSDRSACTVRSSAPAAKS